MSIYNDAMEVSPCRFVVTYGHGYHCATHGVELDARNAPVACEGFYKVMKTLQAIYSRGYRAGVESTITHYPRQPEVD